MGYGKIRSGPDRLVWHRVFNGTYSVNSRYYLATTIVGNASSSNSALMTMHSTIVRCEHKWKSPIIGKFILNVDIALNSSKMRAILCDYKGNGLVALSKKITESYMPQIAEIKVLEFSLLWACDIGLALQEVEYDALIVVQLISRQLQTMFDGLAKHALRLDDENR
ncbi:hypothetical protein PanWU01x14_231730 [Parasponia andersonii]|uniref:RNase H type-1 domain-containing protein n=1 Tax=Parasponia andersonii TaxID=3476 RepID=A0A2P5BK65_PARAD|nr:hypothetical protein PanWU01x14_231730 [Parasponia andersonii]